MAMRHKNLGQFGDYQVARNEADKLNGMVTKLSNQSNGNYFIEIKSPRRGLWVIWLMKE